MRNALFAVLISIHNVTLLPILRALARNRALNIKLALEREVTVENFRSPFNQCFCYDCAMRLMNIIKRADRIGAIDWIEFDATPDDLYEDCKNRPGQIISAYKQSLDPSDPDNECWQSYQQTRSGYLVSFHEFYYANRSEISNETYAKIRKLFCRKLYKLLLKKLSLTADPEGEALYLLEHECAFTPTEIEDYCLRKESNKRSGPYSDGQTTIITEAT